MTVPKSFTEEFLIYVGPVKIIIDLQLAKLPPLTCEDVPWVTVTESVEKILLALRKEVANREQRS